MNSLRKTGLILFGLWELSAYDFKLKIFGFERIHRGLAKYSVRKRRSLFGLQDIVDSVELAACFYCKPVVCLQRSVIAARMLRRFGISAQMVIGYRPTPFFTHAWVEVDGKVVNDSAAYKTRLQVLSVT